MNATRSSVTCLGCGCACDDIEVIVDGGRVAEARQACELGVRWFGDGRVPARARAGGRDVSQDEALAAAARLVEEATRPLVYLAPGLSCEAQREAIALADRLRAAIDSVTSATAGPSVLAAQERGRVAATLGEVRHRADVIVYWGVDPAERYPRFAERYGQDAAALHVPQGRQSRTVVAVDIGPARGPGDADVRIAVPPGEAVETLTALAALTARPSQPWPVDGVWARARQLLPSLVEGRYVVFVADAEPQAASPRDSGRSGALIALVQALNGPARASLVALRGGGNRNGADACLTSQTGYPFAVDFARGYPRYQPAGGTARERLDRGEVDALLVLGEASQVPADLVALMATVPCAAIGPRASEGPLADAAVAIDTGIAGIHESGTALRLDDVPLPVAALLEGPPSASRLVRALCDRVRQRANAVG